jgi:hypothetical protein
MAIGASLAAPATALGSAWVPRRIEGAAAALGLATGEPQRSSRVVHRQHALPAGPRRRP